MPTPAANSPEVNVLREMGKFKPVIFGQIHAAGDITRWVRLRLRAALWRQWKTPRRRRAALIALGVRGELRNMAGSGHGPWHLARSKALFVGLSNAHFKSLGLPSLFGAC